MTTDNSGGAQGAEAGPPTPPHRLPELTLTKNYEGALGEDMTAPDRTHHPGDFPS